MKTRRITEPPGSDWDGARTPDAAGAPRLLDPQRRTYLYATPDGRYAGIIIVDERNFQSRISYRDIVLPELTTAGES
ncbi:MAG: hypothetical protein AB4911_23910 [Oscillochloridaceae bacterium umkhey_bin13]